MHTLQKTAQVLGEMNYYKISILDCAKQSGREQQQEKHLNTCETVFTGHNIRKKNLYNEGVTIMLSNMAEKAIKDCKAVSSRIITAIHRIAKKFQY